MDPGGKLASAERPATSAAASRPSFPHRPSRLPHTRPSAAFVLVGLLALVGGLLRLRLAHEPLFADELSTWWIVTDHGIGDVLSIVHSDAEITPPLFFVLAWLGTRFGQVPELVRAPSLVAGVALVPLVYALGLRTVGRSAGLLAATLTTFAPFTLYYAADARGYSVMMAAAVLSTLAMLLAVDSGRRRWWVIHAVATAAAVYSHYTAVPLLAMQAVWVLVVHPEHRRSFLTATGGAIALFLPWTSGLLADLSSPTTKILAALSPFDWASVRFTLSHWVVGYPVSLAVPLRDVPGRPGVVLLAAAAALAAGSLAGRATRSRVRSAVAASDRRLLLVVGLALSVPVTEAALNLVETRLFSVRNLAASWPPLILGFSFLLVAAGRRVRVVASVAALAAYALGTVVLMQDQWQKPDHRTPARAIDRLASPSDVVLDVTGWLSPGPLTPLDVELERPHQVIRAGAPAERDHPFGFGDPVIPIQDAIRTAVDRAAGGRIFVVRTKAPRADDAIPPTERELAIRNERFPSTYRLEARSVHPGVLDVVFEIYRRR